MPLLTKTCPMCGHTFSCPSRPHREQQTCSRRCGAQWRKATKPIPQRTRRPPRTAVCHWCGTLFVTRRYGKVPNCCSYRCAAHRRWSDPVFHARASAAATRKSDLQRTIAATRMRHLNGDPAIRARMAATMRGRAFSGQRGGNGTVTREQKLLAEALGWPMEFSVTTGDPRWPCAIVDLAYPALLIAIEVDGSSHHTAKQRNRDRRKSQMLTALGWRVLRFWNAEITRDLDRVIEAILQVVTTRATPTQGQIGALVDHAG